MYGQLQKTVGASERVRDILREEAEFELSDIPAHESAPQLKGERELQGCLIRLSYSTRNRGAQTDRHGGSCRNQSGACGHSGAGKSTITALLLGFHRAQRGELVIDGQEIGEYDLPELRANIGLVPQEVILFGGSIRDNIAYGRPEGKWKQK